MRGHRFGIALTTALLAIPAIAGCGGGGDESPPGSFRYSWWGSGERNERTQAVIDLFHKADPGITIETEPTGDFNAYWERLTVQSAAGGAPCVPQMQSRYMADYSERNHLRPLDEYVANGSIDISGIPESILATGKGTDGRLYSIPTGVFLYASLWNKDMAAQAGLPAPDPSWTWEQWEAWLRSAANALPEGKYAADLYPATDFSGSFFNWVFSHGGQVFGPDGLAFDRQLLVDWWTMWDGLRRDGVTITADMLIERGQAIEEAPLSTGVVLWNSQPQNQLPQTSAVASDNAVGTIGMTKLPNGPAGTGETFGSNGLSISTSCSDDDVPAAVRFINFFLNDPAAAMAYGSTNGVVSVEPLIQQQIDAPDVRPELREQLQLVQTIVRDYHPQGFVFPIGGRAATDAFTRAAQSVFLGQATPDQAADAFLAQAAAAMRQAGRGN